MLILLHTEPSDRFVLLSAVDQIFCNLISGRNKTERQDIYVELKNAFVDSVDKVSCSVSESMNSDR